MRTPHQSNKIKNEFDYLNDVKMDFSEYEIVDLSELERNKMKNVNKQHKKFPIGRVSALAACVALVVAFSQTAIAKDFFSNIIASVSTGHNQFFKMDDSGMQIALPDEIKGKLFDKDGNPVTVYKNGDKLYDEKGNEIADLVRYVTETLGIDTLTVNGEKIKIGDSSKDDIVKDAQESGQNIVYDINQINDSLNFTAKMPEYLPENFEFFAATADGDYLFLYYADRNTDEYFTIHERVINDDTAYETSTDGSLIETTVNGNKAVLMDDRNLEWETDGISISVMGHHAITTADVLKVADSIK